MKFIKGLFATLLIVIILGGLGYIGYSYFYMGGMNHQSNNTTPNTTATPNATAVPSQSHQGMTQDGQMDAAAGSMQNSISLSVLSIQNRDRLNQAIGTINQAIDLITIDPYSKLTLPAPKLSDGGTVQGQTSQNPGAVNIYPNGNNTVTVTPNGTNVNPGTNTTPNSQIISQNQSYVYDQTKLQELHGGIYSLAQGMALINQINNDLLGQSGIIEGSPNDYQTYVIRYTLMQQNKTKLSKAIDQLSSASVLINVNPYASPDGYPYDTAFMANLHQGIYKLAQGMALLNDLNDSFTMQMSQATAQAQMIVNGTYQTSAMTHGSGLFGNLNLTTVFNLILIVMIIGLAGGIIGAILSLFRRAKAKTYDSNPENEPNSYQ